MTYGAGVRLGALAVLAFSLTAAAQDVAPAAAAPVGRAPEAPIAGFVRKTPGLLALTLPGGSGATDTLELGGFEFEGDGVPTDKVHLRQLAPGVFEITSVAYTVGYWRFHVLDGSNYYGLGEHFDQLNHSHTVVRNVSTDNGHIKGSTTYKPMPFYMSTRGYGLWVDTTADATFDMNASSESDVIVDVPAEKLRIVLFTGPQFPEILDRFTSQSGRSMLPPYWAFAPWLGRDFHRNEAEVKADVDKARALGIPASVILIDSPWTTAYNSYKFNPKQFGDAPAMVKYIHDNGYKLVLWHTSWINNKSNPPGEDGFAGKLAEKSENYDEAAGNGFFVKALDGSPYVGRWWKGQGSLIDFTNPHAKQWWQDQVRQAIKAGADGFKDDDAEGSFVSGPVKFADGTDPRLMRNRYAVLYNNAMEELMQKDLKGNGVLFCRSVTQGANGIGMLWGGDNEATFSPENGLPSVVTAGLGAGISGMPLWTADIGGYLKTASTPDAALFQRWTEYAAFTPTMEVLSAANVLPWDYDKGGDDRALATFKKFAVLHMSLFPYRYAAAQEAAKTGMPIMRALALNYQNDDLARQQKDEYLFGPDLLVAPVIAEGTQRAVYLPAGEWVDYWTGVHVSGGRTIVVDAAIDQIPVYARAGAVIPKIPEDVMTLVPESESGNKAVKSLDDRRVYEVIGDAGSASIKDFEGRSIERSGSSLKITGEKAAQVTVRFRNLHPKSVTVNGAAAKLGTGADGQPFVSFEYAKETNVSWQ
ncbi:MAG: glycoside hydrolase family 31 protein [Edaphobacter sp.]|uniref:TIM-barrel domain-containing protein n=1 Tax=Edaphobacter sp. TaxID=1934404 RepID=UPI0023919D01|nr:TIM-barrel domain-containing protein [Edaphobacter sp.]MDE1176873.1 glycoside hydrolase family 31 protein [Edaphobacter sp.]